MNLAIDNLTIDHARVLQRIHQLGELGRDGAGRLTRLAATEEDRAARIVVTDWMRELGLAVRVDVVGNIVGLTDVTSVHKPVMMGSHIDSVVDAGVYDGPYGVIGGLAVIEAVQRAGIELQRPLAVAVFTNEEGVRFAPDMMGSMVFAGQLEAQAALSSQSTDGATLGEELAKIGFAGNVDPVTLRPHAFVELHIEQGPILERTHTTIGVVRDLQGISWQRLTFEGQANHAGTTPTPLRKDAGLAAARVVTFLRDQLVQSDPPVLATAGEINLAPGAINVVPGRCELTIDLRSPDQRALLRSERVLSEYLAQLEDREGVVIRSEALVRTQPVVFDEAIADTIEAAAQSRALTTMSMTSGAGHDAQMLAAIVPSGMIFVPSRNGISHNPDEFTHPEDLAAGVEVLADTVIALASA